MIKSCRDSLKTKTCPREECRFYHLKGTKTVSQGKSQPQYKPRFESKNKFEALGNNKQDKEQVFQQDQPSDKITLTDIMKEIMSIKARQDLQERNQTTHRSDDQDWRKPDSQNRRSTQDDHRDWDSQRRNRSQRSQRSQS